MTPPPARGSATPRAIALLTATLGLDGTVTDACEPLDDGGAVWRLCGGFDVTLRFADDGAALWHLSDRPRESPREGGP